MARSAAALHRVGQIANSKFLFIPSIFGHSTLVAGGITVSLFEDRFLQYVDVSPRSWSFHGHSNACGAHTYRNSSVMKRIFNSLTSNAALNPCNMDNGFSRLGGSIWAPNFGSAFAKMCSQPDGHFISSIAPICTDPAISVQNSPTEHGKARQKAWREGQVQLVEKICNLLIRNNWNVDTINELEKLKIRVRGKLVNKVIRQVNDPDLAYHFFHWAGRRPSYNHNTYTYHAIIEVMGAAQKFDVQLQLLQEMHRGGIQLNASTFNIIMLAYTRARFTEGVVNIFNQMKVYGCNPNAFSFKCAVRSLVWSGRVAEALSMYRTMVNFGYVADNFTYNGLIEGLSKAGNVNEAQLIFQEMEDRGLTPDAIAHAALIKGLDMEGRIEEACRLFQDMTGKNLGTVVDTHKGVMGVFSKKRRKHDLSSSASKKATALSSGASRC